MNRLMNNDFFAMISRMRYINRWALMRNTRNENIEEHSLQVAILSHALAVIRNEYFSRDENGLDRIYVNPEHAATLAIFHDTNEIITGDMPTPVKYFDKSITDAYKNVERQATEKLIHMLPEKLRDNYKSLLSPDVSTPENIEAKAIIKAADRLSALIKCIEEEKAGNSEFISAGKKIRQSIDAINLPEVKYFVENFLPSYSKTLDELDKD